MSDQEMPRMRMANQTIPYSETPVKLPEPPSRIEELEQRVRELETCVLSLMARRTLKQSDHDHDHARAQHP